MGAKKEEDATRDVITERKLIDTEKNGLKRKYCQVAGDDDEQIEGQETDKDQMKLKKKKKKKKLREKVESVEPALTHDQQEKKSDKTIKKKNKKADKFI